MSRRVLIVEDEFLIALDRERALQDAGYDVCAIATSESEALAAGETFRPDLAVVDITLNPGDGRVVAAALRRRYATLILFATSQKVDALELQEPGAVGCLPKPYAADAVPQALEAMMDLSCASSRTALLGPIPALV
jgi:DNA-binding response OmpR family regulator